MRRASPGALQGMWRNSSSPTPLAGPGRAGLQLRPHITEKSGVADVGVRVGVSRGFGLGGNGSVPGHDLGRLLGGGRVVWGERLDHGGRRWVKEGRMGFGV